MCWKAFTYISLGSKSNSSLVQHCTLSGTQTNKEVKKCSGSPTPSYYSPIMHQPLHINVAIVNITWCKTRTPAHSSIPALTICFEVRCDKPGCQKAAHPHTQGKERCWAETKKLFSPPACMQEWDGERRWCKMGLTVETVQSTPWTPLVCFCSIHS